MIDWSDAVQQLLRPSEQLIMVIETSSIDEQPPSKSTKPTWFKRVLAVVSHDELDSEQGSLLIFKVNTISHQLQTQYVYPICGDFSISIFQYNRAEMPDDHEPFGNFGLVVNPASVGAEKLRLRARAPDAIIKEVVAECKRLKELSDSPETAAALTPIQTYSWLAPYTYKRRDHLPTSTSTHPDLRTFTIPLHKKLSNCTAGLPGDDLQDIITIRDDWIVRQARKSANKERHQLRIRIGTFNVNGKLPSQDLSSWVGNAETRPAPKPVIPSVQSISPLSLGEPTRDPIEKMQDLDLKNSDSCDSITSSTATDSTVVEPAALTQAKTDLGSSREDETSLDLSSEPDLLVFSLQEMDLSTEALIYSTDTAKAESWCMAIFAALGEKGILYEKLAFRQLVGMFIIVLVKKKLRSRFLEPRTCSVAMGIMGLMGNKGAVAVQLLYLPDPDLPDPKSTKSEPGSARPKNKPESEPVVLTFVNSHLAAFDEMYDKRNTDFQELSKRLMFPSLTISADDDDDEGGGETYLASGVYESEVLFWMGDLNYRLDLPDSDVRDILSSNAESWEGRFETLLQHDQLKKAMKSEKAFEGFKEYPITHMPSYRYGAGISTDSLGYDMKRKPAWTDRILHIPNPYCAVSQHSYRRHDTLTISDHRPMAADFTVEFDVLDSHDYNDKVHSFYREVMSMDDEGGGDRPILVLDATNLDFGKIQYMKPVRQVLTLRNPGKIACAFRFIPPDNEIPIAPGWLTIEPMTGLILPDEIIEISLSVFISNNIAVRLNDSSKQHNATLILHTAMGKDHFISVTAEYEYTCFANTLTRLNRLPSCIRALGNSDHELLPERSALSAPREVMRLINWLMSNQVNHALLGSMFSSESSATVDEEIVTSVREFLDSGEEFSFRPSSSIDTTSPQAEKALYHPPEVVQAIVVTLLRLLASLKDPVVPTSLHVRCAQMTSRDEAFEMLDALPASSVNIWISVTAFLHFVCQQNEDRETEAKRLASIFSPILLRDDPESQDPPASLVGRRDFVAYFIG